MGLAGQTRFVGRSAELATLAGWLQSACAGQGGVALITGEPGIGKTRIAEEFTAGLINTGVRTLWGKCYEGEGAPVFWPWVQVIRALIRPLSSDALRAHLDSGASEIAAIVPAIRDQLPDVPPAAVTDEYARFRLFEAVTDLLQRAATEQPLVIVLDDLHWADVPSLLMLRHLATSLGNVPVLILGTYRDIDVTRGHPLADVLVALSREGSPRLMLHGFDEEQLGEFVEQVGRVRPAPALLTELYRQTEGNPFFAAEVVRLLARDGRIDIGGETGTVLPERVREAIRQRLDQLSSDCQRLLGVAAVIGREFRIASLALIYRLDAMQLLPLLDEAETARVVNAVPGELGHYRFVHALIRETLYEELTAATRIRLHRDVGAALEAEYGPNQEPHLAELAFHWVQAAPAAGGSKAVDYATRAAERAMRLLAFEDAARHYGMALRTLLLQHPYDEVRRCDLLLALGDAHERAGDRTLAAAAFEEAAACARAIGDAARLARAALGYGGPTAVTNVVDVATVHLLEESLELLGDTDQSLRARVLARLADEIYFSRQHERREALGREAVAIARRVGESAALAAALNALHWSLWNPDTLDERLAVAAELLHVAENVGDTERVLLGHNWRIVDLAELGRFDEVDVEIDRLNRLAAASRQPYYVWIATLRQAARIMMTGRFEEAERLIERAMAIGQRVQPETAATYHIVQTFQLRREQGGLTAELEPIYRDYTGRPGATRVYHAALAWLFAELDRADDARRLFEEMAADDFVCIERDYSWFGAMHSLAEVSTYLGDAERARRLYAMLRPYQERSILAGRFAVCVGSAHLPLGMLATTSGAWEQAGVHFERALLTNARIGARPYLAWSRFHYARMLWLRGDPPNRLVIRELLGLALASGQEMGMTRLADRIAGLKGAMDEATPVADRRHSSPNGLTPREVDVLRLLAMGRTTREIAVELTISVATVERHITNLYGKISARSRADATAYAFRTGLADLDRR